MEPTIETTRAVRVESLTADVFLTEYVKKNRPVVVTGAMRGWKALQRWTPELLMERFGNERVQVYGDLFRLANIMPFAEYIGRYFGRGGKSDSGKTAAVPYLRWYCHLIGEDRVPWADDVFVRLSEDWSCPEFFPTNSFALPFCPPSGTLDPSQHWFPARGLFISGQGARTRLHPDPWCSDALLCQIYGRKDFVMYDPSQGRYLERDGRCVDIETPDLKAFPDFERAVPAVRDTLEPGEMVLVPAEWYHHFKSISDSISLTWNFVHLCRLPEFLTYLAAGPPETEIRQLAYAYFESRGHRPLDGSNFIDSLMALRPAVTSK